MADPKPLNRAQLAKIAGNDPEAIRLLERLFLVAGEKTPDDIDGVSLGIPVDVSGAMETLAVALRDYAEIMRGHDLSGDIAAVARRVDGLELLPPLAAPRPTRYGQFYDTTTQVAALVNTAYAVSFNTVSMTNGVYLSGSQVTVDTPGVYNFQLSVQLDKTSGGVGRFNIWFAKNGADIADSASTVRIQGNDAEVFTAVNLFIPLAAGDYVQIMWAVDDTSVQMQAFPAAAPIPGIPSIILTVSDNMENAK